MYDSNRFNATEFFQKSKWIINSKNIYKQSIYIKKAGFKPALVAGAGLEPTTFGL